MATIRATLQHKINPSDDGTDTSLQLNSSATQLNSSRNESMSEQSETTKRTKVKVRVRSGRGPTGRVSTSDQNGQSDTAHGIPLPTHASNQVVIEEATLSPVVGEFAAATTSTPLQ